MTRLPALLAALALITLPALAADPAPFQASYQVLRGSKTIGEADMRLQRHGADWRFTTRTQATGGIAGLLGLDIRETTDFRWQQDQPELLRYDYQLASGLTQRTRVLTVDWKAGRVQVDDSRKGRAEYASTHGLTERHLLTLSLAQALARGQRDFALPLAVQDRIERQAFTATQSESITVPIGTTAALRVQRPDKDNFVAWYAPERYPVPVKLRYGDKLELRLKSFTRN
ncbi:MAG TPA: DUF3108 domain-containing protein [Rhodanobacteraceae bacterium]|nr:DUF3108 domain-containing protein [Rhodanobacteraceae bacterium]